MSDKIAFVREFRACAGQLNTYEIAGDWMRLAERMRADGIELSAADAARWADLGFYPGEAEATIRGGVTAQMYAELEQHAEDEAGGPDALAAERIARMLDDGTLVREVDTYGDEA